MTNIPYTYLIGWSHLNKYYYGVRYSKTAHPSDLWVTYFTSSKIVKRMHVEHGEPDIIQVRRTFTDAVSAKLWEDRVLRRMSVHLKEEWLNIRSDSFKGMVMTEEMVAKIKSSRSSPACKEKMRLNRESWSDEKKSGIRQKMQIIMKVLRGTLSIDDAPPDIAKNIKEKTEWKITAGYTNEYRLSMGMKPIPGKPKGAKDTPESRKRKSESSKNYLMIRHIKTNKCTRVLKEDGLRMIESGEWQHLMKGKGHAHSEESKQKLKLVAQNREVFHCHTCCRKIKGKMNWDRHLVSMKHKKCLPTTQTDYEPLGTDCVWELAEED